MTSGIIVSVVLGIAYGFFLAPDWLIDISGTALTVGLCMLLFFVGLDLGKQGNILAGIKDAGWRALLMPVVVALGTFAAGAVAGLFLPYSIKEMIAVTAGLGWYTLAPAILADYSNELSAISFLHNVMRELFGIILIPVVAKYIGYLETVALPGAAAMDVCLPVVEKATNPNIAVYSFVTGVVLSVAVPVLMQIIVPFL